MFFFCHYFWWLQVASNTLHNKNKKQHKIAHKSEVIRACIESKWLSNLIIEFAEGIDLFRSNDWQGFKNKHIIKG